MDVVWISPPVPDLSTVVRMSLTLPPKMATGVAVEFWTKTVIPELMFTVIGESSTLRIDKLQ
jgi:hypothetical protein